MEQILASDDRLIEGLKKGEPDSVRQLLALHYGPVLRFLYHLARNEADAEELAQETFLKVVHKIGTFKKRSKLTTWIHQVAYREFTKWRRRKLFAEPITEDSEPGTLFEQCSLEAITLERAIRSLPTDLRVTFSLCEVTGLTVEEAGVALGIPGGTVKSRLHRARGLLRACLEPAHEEKINV